jgi:electron transport complex protein RnfB
VSYALILKSIGTMGGLALALGTFLFIASKKFHVETDPRVERVLSILPGLNCGACGYSGCEGAAEAIAKGAVSVDVCSVGGAEAAEKIADLLGVKIEVKEAAKPFLKCGGGRKVVEAKFDYDGVKDCLIAQSLNGGDLSCSYGCLSYGDCERACPFDALRIIDGLPQFDDEKCVRCGLCVKACPRNLIELIPEKAKLGNACSSKDKGKVVRKICKVGCIACGACVKICESGAIQLVDNLAIIDYEKCTACLKCVEKCPTKCLISF